MQAANQHALKSIWQSMEQSALRSGGKELSFPEDYLILLHGHPDGNNKKQDKFKDQEFTMIKRLWEPNAYCKRLVNDKVPQQVVNKRQLQDLETAHQEMDSSNEELSKVLSFNTEMSSNNQTLYEHHYATFQKGNLQFWSKVL